MSTNSVSGISGDSTTQSLVSSSQTLAKDDFLTLLVTQLRYQDPMNPMENTEFVAQLAQFSSLEEMQNIDSGIEDLSLLMRSVNNSLATEIIGKDVKFVGDAINLRSDGAEICYTLAEEADVTLKIYDDEDNLVATLKPGQQAAGNQSYAWDGADAAGEQLPEGRYHYELDALDADGLAVQTVTYGIDEVRGLRFDGSNAILMLSDSEIYLSDIYEILGH